MTVLNLYLGVVAVTACALTWYSAYLHNLTPWRDTPVGRHLLWFTVALGVTFTALTLGLFIHDKPLWFDVIRAALYTSTPVVVAWRVALQLQARRHPLAPKREEPPHVGDTDTG